MLEKLEWFKNQIWRWFITYKCQCGTKLYFENTTSCNEDYIEHTLCEYDIKCKHCDNIVGHWAYGYREPPCDKYEELLMRIESVRCWFKNRINRDKNKNNDLF